MATVDSTVPQATSGATAAGEGAGITVLNPATGDVVGHVPQRSADEVAEIVGRARAAQPGWWAMGFDGRARIMRRAQKWVMDNAERVAQTIVSETGKTFEDAVLAEVAYAGGAFGFWAKHAAEYMADEKVRTSSILLTGRKLVLRYEPLGVVGVIGPWNYPLTNSFGDCIPALMAGNAAVLKPSEQTPLTSLLMAEMLDECGLPADVFQVATGAGETGAALIDNVDMVMFTGSTSTGRKIAQEAAKNLIPTALELGGKDPLIVLSDADLERAANAAVYYSMQNAGQTCISVERVYVEEPVYDEFVGKVVEKVRELRQGDPSGGPGTVELGAMTFPKQMDIVRDHVEDAKAKGARILTGGKPREGRGDFWEPTVLVDVDHSMKAMTEETFGPTLPIQKVRDAEEAIRLANDTPYGLGGSLFTKDVVRGEQLARRIHAGAIVVNDAMTNYYALELPMGGWKASGLGHRHGSGGIRKFCKQQAIVLTRVAPKRDLHMFPNKPRRSRFVLGLFRFLYGRGERD